jgi:hypothetical protein
MTDKKNGESQGKCGFKEYKIHVSLHPVNNESTETTINTHKVAF